MPWSSPRTNQMKLDTQVKTQAGTACKADQNRFRSAAATPTSFSNNLTPKSPNRRPFRPPINTGQRSKMAPVTSASCRCESDESSCSHTRAVPCRWHKGQIHVFGQQLLNTSPLYRKCQRVNLLTHRAETLSCSFIGPISTSPLYLLV